MRKRGDCMSKGKKIKPDEYYNDGIFEVSRIGEKVHLRKNITQEQHEKFMEFLASKYEEIKSGINYKIQTISNEISNSDPLELMNFAASMSFASMVNHISECQYTPEQNFIIRAVEYIQSILVSSGNNFEIASNNEQDNSEKYFKILNLIIDLYKDINKFYGYWIAHIKKEEGSLDDDIVQYIVQSQMASFVRGDRYQIYEIEHLEKLLYPHNDVILEVFELTANELINGLEKLQYSLSSAKADALNNLQEIFIDLDEKIEINENGHVKDLMNIEDEDRFQSCVHDLVGNKLYDVKKVTGWSDKIIDSLSYRISEYDKFFSGEYCGWPIIDLPIQKKPFIKINNISYCFNYYNLFDNIYRIMQKTIKELKPAYVNDWSHIQQRASEQMVEELFKKLLPNSITFRDNYYPKNKSLKQCDENDVIVVYDDILLIIEVKAGSFTYTPAITDYKSHINSFKALIEKADHQCERTINYIKNNEEAAIYDNNKNLKTILEQKNFREIYSFCVTVDNFNEFAAKAEKLSFISIQSGTIAISIDDLRVYSDYFDSPLYFLHYLKQRKLATKIKNLNLYDELDHLGLYIKHNLYSITMNEFDNESFLHIHGYREEIDNYFISLYTEAISFSKPEQEIPYRIKEIIEYLEKNNIKNKTYLSSFLLDFALDAKKEMVQHIDYILNRQMQLNKMIPMITFGELRYCLFVNQPGIPDLGEKYKCDYIDASILYKHLDDYVLLNLYYNNDKELEKVCFSIRSLQDIPNNRYDELMTLGEKYAHSRMESFKKQTGKKKIGRNDLCLCGSGKKYKKCCGR
jgi:hypothetical protein